MPLMGVPPVMASASPCAVVKVTRVITNGGTFSLVTIVPCQIPTTAQTASVDKMATGAGSPALTLNQAARMPARPASAPTDKSMPPVRMTRDSPMARMPTWARSRPMTCRLPTLAYVEALAAMAAKTTTQAMTTPASGDSASRRSSRLPVLRAGVSGAAVGGGRVLWALIGPLRSGQ